MTARAVTFDLDGTLYGAVSFRRRYVWRNFWRLRTIRVARREREKMRGLTFADGEAFSVEQARRVGEALGRTPEQVRAQVEHLFGPRVCEVLSDIGPFADARSAVERLVEAGVRVAVVSDFEVEDKLAALGLTDLPWSALVGGERVGALKPAVRPFEVAAKALGVPLADIVHIGDRADTDGAGARAAGCRFLLLQPGGGAAAGSAPSLAAAADQILGGAV